MDQQEIVWLSDDRCFAYLLQRTSYVSLVNKVQAWADGNEEWVENSDYITWEERIIEYESDDD